MWVCVAEIIIFRRKTINCLRQYEQRGVITWENIKARRHIHVVISFSADSAAGYDLILKGHFSRSTRLQLQLKTDK